jgi:glycosyltransferase involved in cell wall biosynthesis
MRVLGVDPGLGRCGWAVLERRGGRVVAAGYGTIHTDGEQVAPRLAALAARLREVLADEPSLPDRTRLGPPGVDVHEFRPREPDLEQLASRPAAAWGGEHGSAEVLRHLDPARDRIVSYVGKLIVSKGVDLLLAAWPLVHCSITLSGRAVPERG